MVLSEFLVGNMPAFVPPLIMFALVFGCFWWQDRRSLLWKKEYVNPPKDTPSRPFSEIKELGKMASILVALILIGLAVQWVFLG